MESESIIREAVRDDIPNIIKLLNPLYDYRRNQQFFLWQCFENVRSSVLLVAEENHDIVGMYGIQKTLTNTGLIGGQVSWINIAKHKRRSGLFAEMGAKAQIRFPSLDFIFIFANDCAVSACEKSLGMTFIGTLNRRILKDPVVEPPSESKIEIIQADTIFSEVTRQDGFVSFQRGETYRRWRYAASTEYRYFKLTPSTGGYAVIKLFHKDNSPEPVVGDIVDFECNLLDYKELICLFRTACFQLQRMGASAVSTWAASGTPLQGALQELGFQKSNHSSYFGIKALHDSCGNLCDFNSWHLVQSDATNY